MKNVCLLWSNAFRCAAMFVCAGVLCVVTAIEAGEPSTIEDAERRSLEILQTGLQSPDLGVALNAAEGLTNAGKQQEVIAALAPQLKQTTESRRRCELARELVRAGERSSLAILVQALQDDVAFETQTAACEALFRIEEIGEGPILRKRFDQLQNINAQTILAAAALAQWGNPLATAKLREVIKQAEWKDLQIAAWAVARLGDAESIGLLKTRQQSASTASDRLALNAALALLGDETARHTLPSYLQDSDPLVRSEAIQFIGEAGIVAARPELIRLLADPDEGTTIRAAQAILNLSHRSDSPKSDPATNFARNVFPATPKFPRYSEGSVIALNDDVLLYAVTEFQKSSDHADAQIVARRSTDGGLTWGDKEVLQPNTGSLNVMSVTLRYLAPPTELHRPIGMFYLNKNSYSDIRVMLRISNDGCRTFGDPIRVSPHMGYHILNNDRVTRLSTGRLIVPLASTADVQRVNHFVCQCCLSDDGGKTWRLGKESVDYPKRGAMEPEVVEIDGNRVMMIFRNQLGHIAHAMSEDGGETWSEPQSLGVPGPEAPATIRRIPSTGDLLLIWNDNVEKGRHHGGSRNPLSLAISSDEGKTWRLRRNVEAEKGHEYAYTSVLFWKGRLLMTYYVGGAGKISSRFRSIPIRDLYTEPAS
ncbi:exo-alpha-sialidase [Blastopirellula marina]|uniref:Probable sialidase n=1 Tax=Blastopirellula marina DSM 3645 TaxID=314230 RepID=A3ZXG0_9BACT|nr:exo-alpha-sialidase [Blastopirellula marina]EAQ78750.1 probable sialidase [Blastopirellula marina DSM 3645]